VRAYRFGPELPPDPDHRPGLVGVGRLADTVVGMDSLGTYLILAFNGALNLSAHLGSPVTVMGIVTGISLWWMARIEIEELNRQGAKPVVRRH